MPFRELFHTCSLTSQIRRKETTAGNKCMLLVVENLYSLLVSSAIGTNSFNNSCVIEFVQEQICQAYGNPIGIQSDSDPNLTVQ